MLAFVVTFNKSQDCTIDRVVVDIGRSGRTDGQTSTTLSRCWEFCGMLPETFDLTRLVQTGNSVHFPARLRAMDTITQLKGRSRARRSLFCPGKDSTDDEVT